LNIYHINCEDAEYIPLLSNHQLSDSYQFTAKRDSNSSI